MAVRKLKFACCFSIGLLLVGCGGLPSAPPSGGVPVEERPAPPKGATSEAARVPSARGGEPSEGPIARDQARTQPQPEVGTAALTLLAEAGSEARAGHTERADALLERALRIEPKNPLLWHRLATLRLQQGEYQQAVAFASKSNTLAAGQDQLLAANWQVIALARASLGDQEGARAARKHAADYESGTN